MSTALASGAFLDPAEEALLVVDLAEGRARHPWEVILSSIPVSQRRLAGIDDRAASQVTAAYEDARKIISERIRRRYERTFGKGVQPTQGELYHFALDTELAQTLEERQLDIDQRSVTAIYNGYDDAVAEAIRQTGIERRQIDRELGGGTGITGTFVAPPGVAEEVGMTTAINKARELAADIPVAVQTALQASALAGEGIGAMVARTTPVFKGNALRAELTSRYVTIKGYNTARELHYMDVADHLAQYGRHLQKMWVTSVDDRACPVCLALHGSVVDLGSSFDTEATFSEATPPKTYPEGDECPTPPRHARCRCSLVPWVEGWRAGTDHTPESMQADAKEQAFGELGKVPASTAAPNAVVKAGPSPFSRSVNSPKLITGADLRRIPNGRFESALALYRACSLGRGV